MSVDNPFLTIKTRNLLAWLVMGFFAYAIIRGMLTEIWKLQLDESLESSLVGIAAYSGVFYWIHRLARSSGMSLDGFFKKGESIGAFRLVGLTVLVYSFSLGAVWLTYYPLSFLSPSLVYSLVLEPTRFNSESSLPVMVDILDVVVLVLIAPFVEELFFRGVLLNRWATKWGLGRAIVASSVAFAIMHVDFVGGFIFAVAMAVLYIRTNSILGPILCHALNNAISVVFAFGSRRPQGDSAEGSAAALEGFRYWVWIGVVAFVLTLPVLVVFIRRNWPKKSQEPPYIVGQSKHSREEFTSAAADSGVENLEIETGGTRLG